MKLRMNLDALGIATSVACAIHCALLPLFLSSLPLFGVNILRNHFFEAGMIMLAFLIGSWSLFHGYKRHHHQVLPLLVFSSGFIFLVVKEFFVQYEKWFLIPAVLLIVSAHVLNYVLCRRADHCHSTDCDH
jgi:hypothetical protein